VILIGCASEIALCMQAAERLTGRSGVVLGMRTFGMSAPMKIVAQHFGFTAEHVIAAAKERRNRTCKSE
jgi:transketolase